MPQLINRTTKTITVTIAESAAVSTAFDMSDYSGGQVLIPAAWTAANIGFKLGASAGVTFGNFYDHDGGIVEIASPVASRWLQLPPELFGAQWVQLWSQDGAGGDTNQAAARSLTIQLKS